MILEWGVVSDGSVKVDFFGEYFIQGRFDSLVDTFGDRVEFEPAFGVVTTCFLRDLLFFGLKYALEGHPLSVISLLI